MKSAIKILPLLFVASIILASCSSSVRFNSIGKSSTQSKTSDKRLTKKTPKKSSNNELNNKYEKYYKADELAEIIIGEAENWLGVPYRYGGEDKNGADCSGFVMTVFNSFGYVLPRTAQQQWEHIIPINENQLRVADLVFFSNGNRVNHVGIYIGNGNFIHASTSKGVIITELSKDYYASRLIGFGRVEGVY